MQRIIVKDIFELASPKHLNRQMLVKFLNVPIFLQTRKTVCNRLETLTKTQIALRTQAFTAQLNTVLLLLKNNKTKRGLMQLNMACVGSLQETNYVCYYI